MNNRDEILRAIKELRLTDTTIERQRFPYFPFYPSAFLGSLDVVGFSSAHTSAYCLLLFSSWESTPQCFLPWDQKIMQKFCRVTPHVWNKISEGVLKKFEVYEGQWIYNQRLLWEYIKLYNRMVDIGNKRRESANKRWSKSMQLHNSCNANAMQLQCKSNANADINIKVHTSSGSDIHARDPEPENTELVVWKGNNFDVRLSQYYTWMVEYGLDKYPLAVLLDGIDRQISSRGTKIEGIAYVGSAIERLHQKRELQLFISKCKGVMDPMKKFIGQEHVLIPGRTDNMRASAW